VFDLKDAKQNTIDLKEVKQINKLDSVVDQTFCEMWRHLIYDRHVLSFILFTAMRAGALTGNVIRHPIGGRVPLTW